MAGMTRTFPGGARRGGCTCGVGGCRGMRCRRNAPHIKGVAHARGSLVQVLHMHKNRGRGASGLMLACSHVADCHHSCTTNPCTPTPTLHAVPYTHKNPHIHGPLCVCGSVPLAVSNTQPMVSPADQMHSHTLSSKASGQCVIRHNIISWWRCRA